MNWHAHQHLTQVLRRANSLRKELEDIADLDGNNEIAELAKQQAEVIEGIQEILYPPEKKSDVM